MQQQKSLMLCLGSVPAWGREHESAFWIIKAANTSKKTMTYQGQHLAISS
jgi:hypothetical protein